MLYYSRMKTILNIKKIALLFFIATGFIHLSSNIIIANNLFLKEASLLNQIITLPFILTGMIYALASFRLSLVSTDHEHKILDTTLVSIVIIAFVGLLAINILIPEIS